MIFPLLAGSAVCGTAMSHGAVSPASAPAINGTAESHTGEPDHVKGISLPKPLGTTDDTATENTP